MTQNFKISYSILEESIDFFQESSGLCHHQ